MYTNNSVSQLRLALEDRGLDYHTKNRGVLIRRLEDDDEWQTAENARYKVIVRNISEMYSPCYRIYLEPTDTIFRLKELIAEKINRDTCSLVIYFNAGVDAYPTIGDYVNSEEGVVGKIAVDNLRLADYNIHNEDIMYLHIKSV
jgi:hypothetical protein